MSYRELVEWGHYAALEPFGEWRADVRIANLCALTANVNRDPEKRPEPFAISDFMVDFEAASAKQEAEWNPEEGPRADPMVAVWMLSQARKAKRAKEPNGQ